MKLEDIFKEWDVDSKIDRTDLSSEALKTSELHNKYYRIFTNERLLLRKLESDMKILKLDKYEFYVHGPSDESRKKGWTQPACGRILKADVSSYMEADPDIIKLSLRIGVQHEKIDLLESIIKTIGNRNFNIRAAIDFEKFKVGG